jgi:hypothetical protein
VNIERKNGSVQLLDKKMIITAENNMKRANDDKNKFSQIEKGIQNNFLVLL